MSGPETFLDGAVSLWPGDCLEILAGFDADSVDSCVTDPPYHLQSIHKRFAAKGRDETSERYAAGPYGRTAKGFMGKQWDGGDIAFRKELWEQVFRVLKPGAHLVAFGGTRTYHRMTCAIEDAGFEVRDQIGWAFGQGFPKSHDAGNGWGTALKPAWEPICLARKPLSEGTIAANVLRWGTGALNIDGCRVATADSTTRNRNTAFGLMHDGRPSQGGVAGTSIDAEGRWPANVIHDGSEEVVGAFPDAPGQQYYVGPEHGDRPSRGIYGDFGARPPNEPRGDSGSAARFFYTAKADANDRLGSKHPTVKPLDLMQYLVRLVTPAKGLVLDPFAGTGTTGEAAWREGFRAILIEREAEYQADIRRRMSLVLGGPIERRHASIKEKLKGKPEDHGPLFDTYDGQQDLSRGLDAAYEAIRERKAAGGPGWVPK